MIKLENHDDLKRNRITNPKPFTLYIIRSIEFIKELFPSNRFQWFETKFETRKKIQEFEKEFDDKNWKNQWKTWLENHDDYR